MQTDQEEVFASIQNDVDDAFHHCDARLAILEEREQELAASVAKLSRGCEIMFERFIHIETFLKVMLEAANDPHFVKKGRKRSPKG